MISWAWAADPPDNEFMSDDEYLRAIRRLGVRLPRRIVWRPSAGMGPQYSVCEGHWGAIPVQIERRNLCDIVRVYLLVDGQPVDTEVFRIVDERGACQVQRRIPGTTWWLTWGVAVYLADK